MTQAEDQAEDQGAGQGLGDQGVEILPVLDLQGGLIVHARRGQRTAYRPLVTPLATSAEPAAVLAGLLALYPFRTVYIADLDALAGHPAQVAQIAALAAHYPTCEIWLDAGQWTSDWPYRQSPRIVPVVGTESHPTLEGLLACLAALSGEPGEPPREQPGDSPGRSSGRSPGDASGDPPRESARGLPRERRMGPPVLSLDFRGEDLVGPAGILAVPQRWPRQVIAMTLARVGAEVGPDLERLQQLRTLAPAVDLYAAGGVRDGADLAALAKLGVRGGLVATALHSGTLTPAALRRWM
jgi:phosphoribosylformimino-5-aminoimidazole carboxamide ribotide isomerase